MRNSMSTMSVGAYSRLLSHIFVLAAIAAILCAIYLFLRSGALEPQVMVEEPNRVLNDLILGRDYDVSFRIHNRTDRAAHIVGMGIT